MHGMHTPQGSMHSWRACMDAAYSDALILYLLREAIDLFLAKGDAKTDGGACKLPGLVLKEKAEMRIEPPSCDRVPCW